jgi:hypothetical protein
MSTIRAMAAVNLQNPDGTVLPAGAIVTVDPDTEPVAGYLRGGYMKPVALAAVFQAEPEDAPAPKRRRSKAE